MAVNAFPLDPSAGAPAYAAQAVRQALSVLAGYAPAGRPLGANSGVRPGTSATTVTVSGVTVTVKPHSGIVDLETAAAAGPYFYWVDANTTATIGAASGSNDRIDLVSIIVNDPTQDASSTPGAAVVITQGTPAGTPAPPATPTGAFTIAQVNVPKSGTGSPSVTWVATPYNDTGIVAVTQGASWNAGAAPENPQVQVRNGVAYWNGLITTKTGNFATTTTLTLISPGVIPVGVRPLRKINVPLSSNTPANDVRGILDIDGSMTIITGATTGSYVDLAGFSGYITQ